MDQIPNTQPTAPSQETAVAAAPEQQIVYIDPTPIYGKVPPTGGAVTYSRVRPPKSPRRIALDNTVGGVNLWLLMLLSIFFGAIYCRMIFKGGFGIGITAVTVIYYIVYTLFIRRKNAKLSAPVLLTALPMAVLAGTFSFNASANGSWVSILTLIGLFMMNTSLLSGSTDPSKLSSRTVTDALYTHIPAAVSNIGGSLAALFGRDQKKEEKQTSTGVRVLVGLVISIPVVAILIALFCDADAAFDKLVSDVLKALNINFLGVIGDIIVGSILMLYFMPLALTLRSGYSVSRKEKPKKRPLDPVIFATIVYASCIVYISFVLVQFRYLFVGEFADYFGLNFESRPALPDNMTWAEYARSGFGEMSFIIIATFIVIALLIRFCRRSENGKMPKFLAAGLTIVAVCDAIIALSAAMRMRLYSKWCGLTSSRIGVFIIIAVIALALIVVIFKLWNDNVRAFAAIGALAVAGVLVLAVMDVDRVCADVNVKRHIEQGTSIDIDYLGELSYAAAPAVERLMLESPDEDIRNAARGLLAYYYYEGQFGIEAMYDHSIGEWTLDHQRAYNIFKKYYDAGELSKKDTKLYRYYCWYQQEANDFSRYNDEEYPYSFAEYCEMNDFRLSR